jgi:hypothetical protein
MPVCREIGPLVLDEEIEKKALSNLENKEFEISVKIEAIYFDYNKSNFTLPCEGVLSLSQERRELTVFAVNKSGEREKISSCKFSELFPSVHIIRKVNIAFEIHLSQIEVIKFSASNHYERDIIAVTIRMFESSSQIHTTEVGSLTRVITSRKIPLREKIIMRRQQRKNRAQNQIWNY